MNILVDDKPVSLQELAAMRAPGTAPPLPPVRFSQLKLMAQSPLHYATNAVEETPCMENGSAVDYLVFGTKKVIPYPGKVRNGKEWKQFKTDNAESMILTRAGFENANAVADAVKADKRAMRVLAGEHQKEIFWRYLGRDCVSHLDNLGTGGAWVTELKVSNSSNPGRFRWHAIKMLYHAQLGFYFDAAESVTGKQPRAAFIVCVEPKPPYAVTVFRLTHKAIQLGKRCCRLWMERLLQCEAAQRFPAYSESIVDLDVADDEILESEDVPF